MAHTARITTFGQRVRALRELHHWTQSGLGELLQVSGSAVLYWENGSSQPDYARLGKLAELFSVTVDYLLGRTDDPTASPPISLPADWLELLQNAKTRGMTPREVEAAIEFLETIRPKR